MISSARLLQFASNLAIGSMRGIVYPRSAHLGITARKMEGAWRLICFVISVMWWITFLEILRRLIALHRLILKSVSTNRVSPTNVLPTIAATVPLN